MASINRNIWHFSISFSLYKATTIPGLQSSCNSLWSRNMVTHSTTIAKHRRIWPASHRLLGIFSNWEVRTDQPPLTHIIRTTHLKFFGHTVRADPSTDHSRALRSSVIAFAKGMEPRIRPTSSNLAPDCWIRCRSTPLNPGFAIACHLAENRQAWTTTVGTATSTAWQVTWWW